MASQAGRNPVLSFSSLFTGTTRPRLPARHRVYAVGDIHGRADLLAELHAAIAEDDAARPPANTEIILLGDLVDRGPDSAATIRFAMNTQPAFARLTTLKGNHEQVMTQALAGDLDLLAHWLRFGGGDTLESYGVDPVLIESDDLPRLLEAAVAAVPSYVRAWLEALPLTRRIGSYLFVHAGIRPGVPLEDQSEQDMLWIREGFLDCPADLGVTVVHGHTITARAQRRSNRVGIDTGAWKTGVLTALCLEGDRQWFLRS